MSAMIQCSENLTRPIALHPVVFLHRQPSDSRVRLRELFSFMRRGLRRFYALALVAVGLSALPVIAQTVTDPKDLPPPDRTVFLNAVQEQKAGNLEAALRLYEQVHRQFPSVAAPVFNMGLIYDQEGSTGKALDCFRSIAVHSPDYPNLNLFIGIEETKSGNARMALAPLSTAAAQNPQDKEPWFWLARAHLSLKNDVAAMGAAAKAKNVAASDPSVLFLIARIYMDQQDWSHGAETLNEILRDHSDLPGIHEALGTCYFMQDEFDLAATQFNDELAVDPTNGHANAMIGLLFTQRGNYQAAIPYFQAALKQNPNIVTLQLQLSRALWSADNIPEAILHAQAAEQLDQKNVDAHYVLLRLYRESGRTADAKRELAIFQSLTKK